MKHYVIVLVLIAAISVFLTCKKKPEQKLPITVQFSAGDVRIVSAGSEKAVAIGDVLSNEDIVVTGASSLVDLNFSTRGVIRINENSRVSMAVMGGSSGTEQVRLDMKTGKIAVIMAKLSKESGFSILTPTTLAAIRGTSFMVVSDPKNSEIYVLKGKILVQLAKEGKLAGQVEKMLEANKKVVVSEDLVNEIVAGKKEIEAVRLTRKETSDIRKEMKDIRISDTLDPEAKKEFEEITGAEEKPGTMDRTGQETQGKDIQTIPNI